MLNVKYNLINTKEKNNFRKDVASKSFIVFCSKYFEKFSKISSYTKT